MPLIPASATHMAAEAMTGGADGRGFAGAVLDALTSHICVLDASGVITLVNEAWRQFALENSSVATRTGVGTHYLDVCRAATGPGSEEAAAFADGVRGVLEGRNGLFQLEYPCHSPTENRWFVGRVTPLKGSERGAVVSHMNVTDRKLVEFELARLAATDSLTGLPNRRFFLDMANREVDRVRRFRVPASVVMIDVDHFKDINDTYGHAAGDDALRHLAVSFRASLREVDVLARLGGEEFAVLLPGPMRVARSALRRRCARRCHRSPCRRDSTRSGLRRASARPICRLVISTLALPSHGPMRLSTRLSIRAGTASGHFRRLGRVDITEGDPEGGVGSGGKAVVVTAPAAWLT
jgi:diguanylate cyclase (GGDEF)-like protein